MHGFDFRVRVRQNRPPEPTPDRNRSRKVQDAHGHSSSPTRWLINKPVDQPPHGGRRTTTRNQAACARDKKRHQPKQSDRKRRRAPNNRRPRANPARAQTLVAELVNRHRDQPPAEERTPPSTRLLVAAPVTHGETNRSPHAILCGVVRRDARSGTRSAAGIDLVRRGASGQARRHKISERTGSCATWCVGAGEGGTRSAGRRSCAASRLGAVRAAQDQLTEAILCRATSPANLRRPAVRSAPPQPRSPRLRRHRRPPDPSTERGCPSSAEP